MEIIPIPGAEIYYERNFLSPEGNDNPLQPAADEVRLGAPANFIQFYRAS
jgi:hypothetical protein